MAKRTEDRTPQHAVFRKKIRNNRYQNSRPHHHLRQKTKAIKTLLSKAEILTDELQLTNEKIHLKKALKKNGYTNNNIKRATSKEMTLKTTTEF